MTSVIGRSNEQAERLPSVLWVMKEGVRFPVPTCRCLEDRNGTSIVLKLIEKMFVFGTALGSQLSSSMEAWNTDQAMYQLELMPSILISLIQRRAILLVSLSDLPRVKDVTDCIWLWLRRPCAVVFCLVCFSCYIRWPLSVLKLNWKEQFLAQAKMLSPQICRWIISYYLGYLQLLLHS